MSLLDFASELASLVWSQLRCATPAEHPGADRDGGSVPQRGFSRLPRLAMIGLGACALAACGGQARPSFPENLDASNSKLVSVQVEGAKTAQVGLFVKYVSRTCEYVPRAFGVIPQTEPVSSMAYIPLAVQKHDMTKFTARAPLPRKDKCEWEFAYITPEIFVDGGEASVFTPSITVSEKLYLPEGSLKYYCTPREWNTKEGLSKYIACKLTGTGSESITINFSVSK